MEIEEKDEEKDEQKEEDEKEEDENDINDNTIDVLPSYRDIKIEIINDINDFHRNINYYDDEFY